MRGLQRPAALPCSILENRMGVGSKEEGVSSELSWQGQLATAACWDSYSAANLHYGWLGGEVAKALGLVLPVSDSTGKPGLTYALADDAGPAEGGEFQWRIHPELVEGLVLSGALRRAPGR